jgi:5,10-methylenetetrahydrofolate reductase
MEKAKQFGVPVQLGVIIPKNVGMCRYMNANVAGVHVPDDMIEELKKDKERTKSGDVGVELCAKIIKECKDHCDGVHIMSLGWENRIPEILDLAGVAPVK